MTSLSSTMPGAFYDSQGTLEEDIKPSSSVPTQNNIEKGSERDPAHDDDDFPPLDSTSHDNKNREDLEVTHRKSFTDPSINLFEIAGIPKLEDTTSSEAQYAADCEADAAARAAEIDAFAQRNAGQTYDIFGDSSSFFSLWRSDVPSSYSADVNSMDYMDRAEEEKLSLDDLCNGNKVEQRTVPEHSLAEKEKIHKHQGCIHVNPLKLSIALTLAVLFCLISIANFPGSTYLMKSLTVFRDDRDSRDSELIRGNGPGRRLGTATLTHYMYTTTHTGSNGSPTEKVVVTPAAHNPVCAYESYWWKRTMDDDEFNPQKQTALKDNLYTSTGVIVFVTIPTTPPISHTNVVRPSEMV